MIKVDFTKGSAPAISITCSTLKDADNYITILRAEGFEKIKVSVFFHGVLVGKWKTQGA